MIKGVKAFTTSAMGVVLLVSAHVALAQTSTSSCEKKRLEQYHRINRLMVEDLPFVPLYQQVDLYGVNKRLEWKARSDEVIRAYDMAVK